MTSVWKITLVLCLELIIGATGVRFDCRDIDVAFVVGFPTLNIDTERVQWFLTSAIDIILKSVPSNHRINAALVSFDKTARVEFLLNNNNYLRDVRAVITGLRSSGEPAHALADALRLVREKVFVRQNGDRPDAPNLVFIITDGNYRDFAAVYREGIRLRADKQAEIIVVAVTDQQSIFNNLVNEMKSFVFEYYMMRVKDYGDLFKVLPSYSRYLCTRSDVSKFCDRKMDFVLILDESTSVAFKSYDSWFVHMLGFAKNLVQKFHIGRDRSRVAVVTFSETAEVPIHFDSFFDVKSLTDAIEGLRFRGGNTNIAAGLRKTRTDVYRAARGHRRGVENVILLITDGKHQGETDTLRKESGLLKHNGVEIFVIGVTNGTDRQQLRQIASPDGYGNHGHVYHLEEFDQLNFVLNVMFPTCGAERDREL